MATELTPAKIKALISDPKNRIELHDLVHKETENLYALVQGMTVTNNGGAAKQAKAWMESVEEKSKTLRSIFAYGCFFGSQDQAYIWTRSLDRLGSLIHDNGLQVMINLQLYPAMLVLYSGGISATVSGNGSSLKALLSANYKQQHRESGLLINKTHGWLLDASVANQVLELERRKTPLSDHVHDVVATDYPETLVVKDDFAHEFDRWEVVLSMAVAHHLKQRSGGPWAPVGRFSWHRGDNGKSGLEIVASEIEQNKSSWYPISVGIFDGSLEDALEAHAFVKSIAGRFDFF